MMHFLGFMTGAGGLFLFLWYRTVAGLPLRQQPRFIRSALFRRGAPAVSLMLFGAGILMLCFLSVPLAVGTVAASLVMAFLVIRFDRYSANMRLIHSHYLEARRANPGLEDAEILYHTARWRYPAWSDNRVVELIAGKGIENLILLMIINENQINPLQDWELYRGLKAKVSRIVRKGD